MSTPPIPVDSARIAVLCPSWVGDLVMATPVYAALRTLRPDATLLAIVRPGQAALLAGGPFDEVREVNLKGVRGPGVGARTLRAFDPDAVLLLPNSVRSAWTAFRARAKRRIGYRRDGRGLLLTHALTPPSKSKAPTPAAPYYAALAEFALDASLPDHRLRLHVTDEERSAASELLGGEPDRPLIVLAPGASKMMKRWPAARFARVADALVEATGGTVVVTGAPSEQDVCESVIDAMRAPAIDLAARGVALGGVKGVLATADLLITNDTGPRHIAAALGAPTVVLFGPTDPRWTTLDGVAESLVCAQPFLLEHEVADRQPERCSIDRISAADVLAAAQARLAAGRGSGAPGPDAPDASSSPA